MRQLLIVALGGGVGSAARFLVGQWAARTGSLAGIPLGTLLVNVSGSLLIGLLAGYADGRSGLSADLRLLLMVGVLGGFTTFSALSLETLLLIRGGQIGTALLSVGLQLALGLGAAFAGFTAVRPA
jgi:CrcB protein